MSKIQSIKGMHDLLPPDSALWRTIEQQLAAILASYGYDEIRTPILEKTELFKRSIGEVTDIVEKEMYTFEDRNGDSLTLRPEGTASCVRAGIQHALFYRQQSRLWYLGPMFRHERPQKGRYRQFSQLGVECYGVAGTDAEAELLALGQRIWRTFDIEAGLRLEINSLGSSDCRARYREQLVAFLEDHRDDLDADSVRRLGSNPLRILDSKHPETQRIVAQAPRLSDSLSQHSSERFARLREQLDALGIAYRVNAGLVRGLDYYSHTVFEWITDSLGAQGTVCAGGRYDGLLGQLGGDPESGAAGFAMGMERFIEMVGTARKETVAEFSGAYIVSIGERAAFHAPALADKMRDQMPCVLIKNNLGGGSIKSQMKRADKSRARFAVIIGDTELDEEQFTVKDLRTAGSEQLTLSWDEMQSVLKQES